MVIVPWPITDIKVWVEREQELIARWPELTGRVCPACQEKALVGHGQRQRSVHVGEAKGKKGPRCGVLWFWIQRVRCEACGRTHTLLPAFVAPYQRHTSQVRGRASAKREAQPEGETSWREVLLWLALPMLSTTSARRWVRGVMGRIPAMTEAVARWRALMAQGATIVYGTVSAPGTFAAFIESVNGLVAEVAPGWPEGEAIAGANWQASGRLSALRV